MAASRAPTTPASAPTSNDSNTSCCARRWRPAPRAERTAISVARPPTWPSMRAATLTQAISRMSAMATKVAISPGRTSPTRYLTYRRQTWRPRLVPLRRVLEPLAQRGHNRPEWPLHSSDVLARGDSANQGEFAHATLRVQRTRQPHTGCRVGKPEPARHHADDGAALATEKQRPPDDRAVSPKFLPQPITNHRNRRGYPACRHLAGACDQAAGLCRARRRGPRTWRARG